MSIFLKTLDSHHLLTTTRYPTVESLFPLISLPCFTLQSNGKILLKDTELNTLLQNNLVFISTSIPLLGGKGGFGSNLKSQGNRIKKSDNNESSRDLSGRRIRTINQATALAQHILKEPERIQQQADLINKRKQEHESRLLNSLKRPLYQDDGYEQEHEAEMDHMDDIMHAVLKKKTSNSKKDKKVLFESDSE